MIRMTVKIDGMACSMCEAHVKDVIRRAFTIKKISISHRKGEAEIVTERLLDRESLQAALSKTGYRVMAVSAAPYEKKGLFSRLKK